MAMGRSQSRARQKQGKGRRDDAGRERSRKGPQRPALPEVCHKSTMEAEEMLSFPSLGELAAQRKCPFVYIRITFGGRVREETLTLSPHRTASPPLP